MIWNAVVLALMAIRRNVMRSTLTILGIVIGVAAVIIMVTLGNGATAQVSTDISKLGSNMLMIHPGQDRGPGAIREQARLFEADDIEAIKDEVSGIVAVAPASSSSMQAVYGNENYSTTVYGTDNAYLTVRSWKIASGREFSDTELSSGKAVCIIGETVRKEVFKTTDPIGLKMRLKTISCQVIGLLEAKGQSSFGMDQDDLVLIPLHTYQRRVSANRYISSIYVSARSSELTQRVKKDITQLLRQRRKIADNQPDDFNVRDTQELISTLTGTTKLLTMLLGAVAAVSLLVGGIGIMNIMLVSVTERTREIGIRLAIGALEKDVMTQFLVEAIVLSSFGGLMGITGGLGISILGAKLLNVPFLLDMDIVLISFTFSAVVGVVFGYFPARQAARLDPIEALRHE
ncbi:MAG: ABC transporter permease [Bryobacteraceae bacterium]